MRNVPKHNLFATLSQIASDGSRIFNHLSYSPPSTLLFQYSFLHEIIVILFLGEWLIYRDQFLLPVLICLRLWVLLNQGRGSSSCWEGRGSYRQSWSFSSCWRHSSLWWPSSLLRLINILCWCLRCLFLGSPLMYGSSFEFGNSEFILIKNMGLMLDPIVSLFDYIVVLVILPGIFMIFKHININTEVLEIDIILINIKLLQNFLCFIFRIFCLIWMLWLFLLLINDILD